MFSSMKTPPNSNSWCTLPSSGLVGGWIVTQQLSAPTIDAFFSTAHRATSTPIPGDPWVAPTKNLEHPDPRCAALDYVIGAPRELAAEIVVSNNFAFGGVNTSLVFRRWPALDA